jgi:hypothetical protein
MSTLSPTALIWHLTNRGFGSEINTMLLARAYARMRGYEFLLCSQAWNCRVQHGWGDYFEQFCNEVSHPMPVAFDALRHGLEKGLKKNVLFYSDVWRDIWAKKFLSYPLVDPATHRIGQDFWTTMQAEMALVWRLKPSVAEKVNALKAPPLAALGNAFSAVHIRRGDKTLEASTTSIEEYVKHISQPGLPRRVFVLTDDFSVLGELETAAPEFTFVSLCLPKQRGHEQGAFNAGLGPARYEETLRLIAELTIARQAERFFGTGTSNISRVLALLRGLHRVDSIDGSLDFFYLAA